MMEELDYITLFDEDKNKEEYNIEITKKTDENQENVFTGKAGYETYCKRISKTVRRKMHCTAYC